MDKPEQTITFKLDGEVTLDDFARAFGRFHDMLTALASSEAQGARIEWIVEDLAPGSAQATFVGREIEHPSRLDRVAHLVNRYPEIATALSTNQTRGFSTNVLAPARDIGALINGRIRRVLFQTSETDAVVSERPAMVEGSAVVSTTSPPMPSRSYGALQGHVHTLSSRGAYRFILYEATTDHAVTCYLSETSKEKMRRAWGRHCMIEGTISRDRDTGDPIAIRDITEVFVMPPRKEHPHRKARGAGRPKKGSVSAQEAIRWLRDG